MWRSKAKETLTLCLGILLIGCLIQAAGQWKGDTLVFPGVPAILRAFFGLLGEAKTYRQLWTTLLHLLEVLAVSTLLGVAVGLLEGLSDFARNLLRPLMALIRAIPMIVLIVVTMVLLKYEQVPLVAPAVVLIPLISEAASEGCRRIEPELRDVYRLNSDLNARVLWHVHLPMMAGYLRQAYVSAAGMALKLVVSSEYLVQTRDSLGKAVYSSSYFFEYADIYAYALLMVLLVLAVTELPVGLGKMVRAARRKTRPDVEMDDP